MTELTQVIDLYSYRAVSEVVVKGIEKFSQFCSLFRLWILFFEVTINTAMDSLWIPYYYYFKWLSIWIYFIPVKAKLNFQRPYSSFQSHMILQKSF